MEKTGKARGLRVQGGGGRKCLCPRTQLVFRTSKRRAAPRMPAKTQILADGSAQFHLAFILNGGLGSWRRAQPLNCERKRCLQLRLGFLVQFGAPNGEVKNIDGDLSFGI